MFQSVQEYKGGGGTDPVHKVLQLVEDVQTKAVSLTSLRAAVEVVAQGQHRLQHVLEGQAVQQI